MYKPAFGPFHQIAWVTNDFDRSLTLFRDVYGIASFLVFEPEFEASVGTEKGVMKLRVALANVDGVELELIEPVGGGIDAIYRELLPKDGSYANAFHHVCVKVPGTLADWERHLAELHPQRPIHYRGEIGPGARFVYTDERAFLGHYVEHVWFSPEVEQQMLAAVPRFRTNTAQLQGDICEAL
jgi:hypothetical protein